MGTGNLESQGFEPSAKNCHHLTSWAASSPVTVSTVLRGPTAWDGGIKRNEDFCFFKKFWINSGKQCSHTPADFLPEVPGLEVALRVHISAQPLEKTLCIGAG